MTIPDNRTLNTSKEDHLSDHNAMAAAINAGGGLPAATPFTTTTMPNPVTSGDMTVVVLSADNPVLAVAVEGDAFPRWLLLSDAGDGLFAGDGTFDPYYTGNWTNLGRRSDGGWLMESGTGQTNIFAGSGKVVSVRPDLEVNGALGASGVILHSADNTKYRITVNNDGSLSTTVVP